MASFAPTMGLSSFLAPGAESAEAVARLINFRALIRSQRLEAWGASSDKAAAWSWMLPLVTRLSAPERLRLLCAPELHLLLERGWEPTMLAAMVLRVLRCAADLELDLPESKVDFEGEAIRFSDQAWQPPAGWIRGITVRGRGAEVAVESGGQRKSTVLSRTGVPEAKAGWSVRSLAVPGTPWTLVNGWTPFGHRFDDGNCAIEMDEGARRATTGQLAAAWSHVQAAWPELAIEVGQVAPFLSAIRPLDRATSTLPSYSSRELPGVVFVATQRGDGTLVEAHQVAELCVHEYLHNKLYLLEDALPLTPPGPTCGKYYSPWKGTERGIDGMLHAIFVFSRLAFYWRRVADRTSDMPLRSYARLRIQDQLVPLGEALAVVESTRELTTAGRAVLESCAALHRSLC